jgi:hypothetical protein
LKLNRNREGPNEHSETGSRISKAGGSCLNCVKAANKLIKDIERELAFKNPALLSTPNFSKRKRRHVSKEFFDHLRDIESQLSEKKPSAEEKLYYDIN